MSENTCPHGRSLEVRRLVGCCDCDREKLAAAHEAERAAEIEAARRARVVETARAILVASYGGFHDATFKGAFKDAEAFEALAARFLSTGTTDEGSVGK